MKAATACPAGRLRAALYGEAPHDATALERHTWTHGGGSCNESGLSPAFCPFAKMKWRLKMKWI